MSKIKQEKLPIDEKISIGVKIIEAMQNGFPSIEHMMMEEVEKVTQSLIEKYPQYEDEIIALENLASDKAGIISDAAEQEYPTLEDLNIEEEEEEEGEDFDDLDFLEDDDPENYIEE